MNTVFSHIVRKRLSQEYEDVATEAFAYILGSSEASRRGMMEILPGISPNLPYLRFGSQKAEGSMSSDMWGYIDNEPRVFIENKFWAGLTDNQPSSYLKRLAECSEETILLFIARAIRMNTLWRELNRRVPKIIEDTNKVSNGKSDLRQLTLTCGDRGPILALTSWDNVLSKLLNAVGNDAAAQANLFQPRSVCHVADDNAFAPLSRAETSDQKTPALVEA